MGRLYDIIQAHIDAQQPYAPSVRKVAKQLGVSPTTVSNWRSIKELPKAEHLEAIARVTGVPVREVFYAAGVDAGYIIEVVVEESDTETRGLGALCIAGKQDDARSLRGEVLRDRFSNTHRSAGNHDHLTLEFHTRVLFRTRRQVNVRTGSCRTITLCSPARRTLGPPSAVPARGRLTSRHSSAPAHF